ncbi:MAG: GDP-mannose-dependent alpha-(1-6)-phosphatidylinositol monomannoside mannosyltransferase [Chlamydiae bacterium]|nr:GDP-mannose-dependent alpha-(1-6)-phosphatidylinositol monomannoside mannosyltransferase [Chlamydiota bacterium]
MKPMTIVVSDFDLRGSGYMHIAVSLCNELVKRGRMVTALGIGYDMSEHSWPFSIIPIAPVDSLRHVPAAIHNFRAMSDAGEWHPVDSIVVALDIPMQEKFLQMERFGIPYIGIFPIESGPLCNSWVSGLAQMNDRLVISEFGKRMIEDTGLDARYLPVGIDTESWRPPDITANEKATIRKSLGFEEDEFIVLTVADNQERKNLSAAAEIISLARKKINAKWVLVTRVTSPVGWKLDDLAQQFDITEAFTKFDRGLPFDRLWLLYAAADAFLLTSKAEGLCLPFLESQACGLPVLATDATSTPEHAWVDPDWNRLMDGRWNKGKSKGQRGIPLEVGFDTIDPWGNSVRSFVDIPKAAQSLVNLSKMNPSKLKAMTDAGLAYARTRTWTAAGDVLEESIRESIAKAIEQSKATQPQSPVDPTAGGVVPSSLPRPVPVLTQTKEVENG